MSLHVLWLEKYSLDICKKKKKKGKIIISLTIIFQRIKYLDMYLTKELKDIDLRKLKKQINVNISHAHVLE